MARLAVLGADGFIGSAVTRAALGSGFEVLAISIKDPWRIARLKSPQLTHVGLRGKPWWAPAADGPLATAIAAADCLALLAYAPPSPGSDRLAHEREINASGAARIAELAEAAATRVVFSSSADVYGSWFAQPVSEAQNPAPATPYAIAKLDAEGWVRDVAEAICLRIGTVFGPGENGPRAIPSFIRAILGAEAATIHGSGDDVRDYVHVDDVARSVVAAADGTRRAGVFNVGSGLGRTTNEVFKAVVEAMAMPSVSPTRVPSERPASHLVLDTKLARAELGFEPLVPFDEGLRLEVAWLRDFLDRG